MPRLGKNILLWVSTHEIYLEIVSEKSPESRPKIEKSGTSFRDIRPFLGNSFRDLPIWVKI